jgi:outer membrane protein OmpA-like peptidoglycan-associated protein
MLAHGFLRGFCLSLMIALLVPKSFAQQTLTAEEIVNSLQNNAGPATLSSDDILARLQNSFKIDEVNSAVGIPTNESASIVAGLPTLDFEIFFDYNSSIIKPESLAVLMEIGKALNDSRFVRNRFIVGGHTDAAGSSNFNSKLSQRRAEAVRDLLVGVFPITINRVVPFGFGESQLKNQIDPLAAANRRVQIINLGS